MLGENHYFDASILIVDDQPANVALLQQLLQGAGYTRVSATMNPLEVRALHREHRYDLILLDLKMPGMDGFQVMEGLKQDGAEPYLPVIVLTAEPAHKLRALQADARDFISKPFDLVEVKARIHNMLEVRLLYKRLDEYNNLLEKTVRERTLKLRESEARFIKLTGEASDWYWEQSDTGAATTVSGPVLDVLGIRVTAFFGKPDPDDASGWDQTDQQRLQAAIVAREPFANLPIRRVNADGSARQFQVSGEPMFDDSCRFAGFRGIGVETRVDD